MQVNPYLTLDIGRQFDRMVRAFVRTSGPGVINEDVAHQARGQREEMRPTGKVDLPCPDQPLHRLIDQIMGGQR